MAEEDEAGEREHSDRRARAPGLAVSGVVLHRRSVSTRVARLQATKHARLRGPLRADILARLATRRRAMNQDDIRAFFAVHPAVHIQIAGPGDGSPEVAWGDTFIFVRDDGGTPRKMPFATIVTKDYSGFDTESKLDREGLFRLNLDVGRDRFEDLFGFCPDELAQHRAEYDFAALDRFFPHPAYGEQAWASVINPAARSREQTESLMRFALDRALARAAG